MIQLEQSFGEWLLSDGISQNGVRNYLFHYCEFCTFCAERSVTAADLHVGITRTYMVWLQSERVNYHTGQPLSGASRAKHLQTIKRIERFLRERGLYQGPSLVEGIRRPPRKQSVIQGFSAEQLQAILDAVRQVRTTQRYKERFVLLLYLLASTGLRISEALQLRVGSLDHNRRIMIVLGKGNKEREVPFSIELSMLAQEYVTRNGLNPNDFLFASRYGRPLSPASIRDALRKTKKILGDTLGIDRMRVSPHTFRHTFAKLWVIKDGNSIALSRIMGHTTTAMTSNYVKLWGVDLGQSYDSCNPCRDIKVPKFD